MNPELAPLVPLLILVGAVVALAVSGRRLEPARVQSRRLPSR
jgi:hypothetical protein